MPYDSLSSLLLGGWVVSYSFREPDWPAICECKYDEARDEMDREDCPFHCDLPVAHAEDKSQLPRRRRPGMRQATEESAA
jgi:hypothetical protein